MAGSEWLLGYEMERAEMRAVWRSAELFYKPWHGGMEFEQTDPVCCRMVAAGGVQVK